MVDVPGPRASPPPLRVWAAVAALSLIVAGTLSAAYALGLGVEYDFGVPSAHARLSAISKSRHGHLVLIVGSSLANTAIPPAEYFSRASANALQVEVVAVNGGSMDWFEAIRPRIKQMHPDLLIVQQDLLLPPAKDTRNLLEYTNDFVIGWRTVLEGYLLKRRGPVCTSRPEPDGPTRFAAFYQDRYDPTRLPVSALETFSEFREAGVPVIFLQVPRFGPMEQAAPNIRLWDQAIVAAAGTLGFAVWSPPGAWNDPADFCDVGHMSQVGRMVFADWLAARLNREFEAP